MSQENEGAGAVTALAVGVGVGCYVWHKTTWWMGIIAFFVSVGVVGWLIEEGGKKKSSSSISNSSYSNSTNSSLSNNYPQSGCNHYWDYWTNEMNGNKHRKCTKCGKHQRDHGYGGGYKNMN